MSALAEQQQTYLDARARLGMPLAKPSLIRRSLLLPKRPSPPPVQQPESKPAPITPTAAPRVGTPFNFMAFPSAANIIRFVALKHRIGYWDIIGRDSRRPIVAARREAVHLVRSHCRLSTTQIGRLFHRDHTSIINLLRGKRKHPLSPQFTQSPEVTTRMGIDPAKALARGDFGDH